MPDTLLPGAGFAWHAQRILNPWWVIQLPTYGVFLFEGTEFQAEQMRAHKANWEHEVAHKRPASFSDFPKPSRCWNHRGFSRAYWYGSRNRRLKRPYRPHFYCECGECDE